MDDIESLKNRLDNIEKVGFIGKWFKKTDQWVESKIGTEEEKDRYKRIWFKLGDIEEFLGECLPDRVEITYKKLTKLINNSSLRESSLYHSSHKPDRKLENAYFDILNGFDRYIECSYVSENVDNKDGEDYLNEFETLLDTYIDLTNKMVLKRIKREKKGRSKLKNFFESLLK